VQAITKKNGENSLPNPSVGRIRPSMAMKN
jgi:hypothetical protein